MDLKRAYEILGIPENSSMEEVEKRFEILIRNQRRKQSGEGAINPESYAQAYKTIKEAERRAAVERYNETRFGTNSRKKQLMEKLEYFWNYYRWYVFGSIIAIIVLVMLINGFIEKRREAALPPPDLEIMLYGNYNGADEVGMEKELLKKYTNWKRVHVLLNYYPSEMSGIADPAYVQKSIVLLATEHPDVYIVDRPAFERMLQQGALSPLDDLKSSLGPGLSSDKMLTGSQPQDDKPHLYGLDITGNSLWSAVLVPSTEKIAVLSLKPKHPDNAKRFIVDFSKN
jgi:hypothetical protein